MRPPDSKVFDVLGETDCRRILDQLLDSEQPLTQRELTGALDLPSSIISRRMAEIEDLGLVVRASPHAPYDIVFPSLARQLLDLGAELAKALALRHAEEAAAFADERRLKGMREGNLLDRTKEGS